MTAILAIKKEINGQNYIIMASDSLTCQEDLKIKGNTDLEKYIRFPNFVCGNSGVATLHCTLEELSQNKVFLRRTCCQMQTKKDAASFAKEVFKIFQERVGSEEAHGHLLIATPQAIFAVDTFGYVCEYVDYSVSGSGGTVMRGYIEGAYAKIDSPEALIKAARDAVKVACELNVYCGEPVYHVLVTKENLPPAPPKRKARKLRG